MTIITAKIFFPAFYAGYPYVEKPTFGCTILSADMPEELGGWRENREVSPHLREKHPDLENRAMTRITTNFAPMIVTEDNRHGMDQIAQLFRFVDAANLKRDWLFDGLSAQLAVQVYEMGPTPHSGPKTVLKLHAVKIAYTDLLAAYDRLCALHFADPSYPRRPEHDERGWQPK